MREISATATVSADRDTVNLLLAEDLGGVLGSHRSDDGAAPHVVTLTMTLGDGTTVSQDVAMQLGAAVHADDASSWPLSWEPIGHRSLVPRFSGHLEVHRQRWDSAIALVGAYRAPLGPLGALGDALVHDRAEASIRQLLGEIATRIDVRAGEAAHLSQGHWAAPEAFDLPDRARRR